MSTPRLLEKAKVHVLFEDLYLGSLPEGDGWVSIFEASNSLQSTTNTNRLEFLKAQKECILGRSGGRISWVLLQKFDAYASGPASFDIELAIDAAKSSSTLENFHKAFVETAFNRATTVVEQLSESRARAMERTAPLQTSLSAMRVALGNVLEVCSSLLGKRNYCAEETLLEAASSGLESAQKLFFKEFSEFHTAASKLCALSRGSSRVVAALASSLVSSFEDAGTTSGDLSCLSYTADYLERLSRILDVNSEFCEAILGALGMLSVIQEGVAGLASVCSRLLGLARAPENAGDEVSILLASLCSLHTSMLPSEEEFGLFDAQAQPLHASLNELCDGVLEWIKEVVIHSKSSAVHLESLALPQLVKQLKKRVAVGSLMERKLMEKVLLSRETYVDRVNHLFSMAGDLEKTEFGLEGTSVESEDGSLMSTIHLRGTAAILSDFCVSPAHSYFARLSSQSTTLSPDQSSQRFLSSLSVLPVSAAPSSATTSIAAIAAFPFLSSLLPPLTLTLVARGTIMEDDSFFCRDWHRSPTSVRTVVTPTEKELDAISISLHHRIVKETPCPPVILTQKSHLAEALLMVEFTRHLLTGLPCLNSLASIPTMAYHKDPILSHDSVSRVLLAALLVCAFNEPSILREHALLVRSRLPWGSQAGEYPHLFLSLTATLSSYSGDGGEGEQVEKMSELNAREIQRGVRGRAMGGTDELEWGAAQWSVDDTEGYRDPFQLGLALGGSTLANIANAEGTIETPLGELLELMGSSEAIEEAIETAEAHLKHISQTKRAILIQGRNLGEEREASAVSEGIKLLYDRRKVMRSLIPRLQEVLNRHTANRIPVLNRAQRLLKSIYLPSLAFAFPALSVLKVHIESLIRAELLAADLSQQCLLHISDVINFRLPPPPLPPRPPPHLANTTPSLDPSGSSAAHKEEENSEFSVPPEKRASFLKTLAFTGRFVSRVMEPGTQRLLGLSSPVLPRRTPPLPPRSQDSPKLN